MHRDANDCETNKCYLSAAIEFADENTCRRQKVRGVFKARRTTVSLRVNYAERDADPYFQRDFRAVIIESQLRVPLYMVSHFMFSAR